MLNLPTYMLSTAGRQRYLYIHPDYQQTIFSTSTVLPSKYQLFECSIPSELSEEKELMADVQHITKSQGNSESINGFVGCIVLKADCNAGWH